MRGSSGLASSPPLPREPGSVQLSSLPGSKLSYPSKNCHSPCPIQQPYEVFD